MIGCEIPTGVSCSPEEPCCEDIMAPTLKTIDQLTYRSATIVWAVLHLIILIPLNLLKEIVIPMLGTVRNQCLKTNYRTLVIGVTDMVVTDHQLLLIS